MASHGEWRSYLRWPTRICFQTIYNLIGEAHYRMANYEEAESWFKKALEIQPTMVHAHLFYGKMLAKNVSDCEKTGFN